MSTTVDLDALAWTPSHCGTRLTAIWTLVQERPALAEGCAR